MDLKSRLLNDVEIATKQKEIEQAKAKKERERVDILSEKNLLRVEKYYQEFVIQALREVNEAMGGDGPNPDGSLTWRGGRPWTLDPIYTKSESGATIEASVVWHKVPTKSSRSSGSSYQAKAGLKIKVNLNGIAVCSDVSGSNPIPVNLNEGNCIETLSGACYSVIKNINEANGHRYIPGTSKPTIPLEVRKERVEKIRQAYVLPLFRQLAQRYGVSMSQDPYIGFKLFTGEYSSLVPVRPGFKDDVLIIRILSWVGSDPTEAIAISIGANENTVYIGGKNFDVTTQEGVNSLWKFAFQYAATQPRDTFASPPDDHGWDGM